MPSAGCCSSSSSRAGVGAREAVKDLAACLGGAPNVVMSGYAQTIKPPGADRVRRLVADDRVRQRQQRRWAEGDRGARGAGDRGGGAGPQRAAGGLVVVDGLQGSQGPRA